MTKLFISHPGETDFKTFEERERGSLSFSFVPFEGQGLELRMAKTDNGYFGANYRNDAEAPVSPNQRDYEQLIARTVREIRAKGLGKIVISRPHKLDMEIEPVSVFKKLVTTYPKACVYLFTHPDAGTWMGATPETLLKKEGSKISTMSLAGTRKKGEEQSFTAKEQSEQQMVTDFIAGLFEKENAVENVRVSEPMLSDAGNLVHYKSEISADATAGFSQDSLIRRLHPTPAVGGFPREEALRFIHEHEKYERSFYSGYFGMDDGRNFHYFVNLRCMQIFKDSVVLYAGGGITKESDPTAEWEETEAKMRTLLNVIETSAG